MFLGINMDELLKKGGLKAIGINILSSLALLIINLLVLGQIFVQAISSQTANQAVANNLRILVHNNLLLIVVVLCFDAAFGIILAAGYYGTCKDIVTGENTVTLLNYIKNGTRYSLRFLLYFICYIFVACLIAGSLGALLGIIVPYSIIKAIGYGLGIIISMLITVSVLRYKALDFLKTNIKFILLTALVLAMCYLIPIVQSIMSLASSCFLPLIVIALCQKQQFDSVTTNNEEIPIS